jgi:hypothetical protein
MPFTPKTGSLFHAETQTSRKEYPMRGLPFLVSWLIVLSSSGAASADRCADEIRYLAKRYELAISGSNADAREDNGTAMSGSSTPPMQQSRGLGASDTSPRSGGATQTLDSASPQASSGSMGPSAPATGSQADPHHLSVGTRAEAEAMLEAARDAEASGNSVQCFRSLEAAQSLVGTGDR